MPFEVSSYVTYEKNILNLRLNDTGLILERDFASQGHQSCGSWSQLSSYQGQADNMNIKLDKIAISYPSSSLY